MKLTLTNKEKIELAEYWIFKLEDIYGDSLMDYDEYKLYYLPLKSYLLNNTGSSINDDLRHRYEILFKIPRKYYDIDYTAIRDKIFPKLFRVAKVTQKIKKDGKTKPIIRIKYYDLYETDINKYKKDNRYKVKTYGRIWTATQFADKYIRMKKNLEKYNRSFDNSWQKEIFKDMNKFQIEITPKPIPKYIGSVLKSISNNNNSTEKSIRPIKENEAISLIERLKNPNYKVLEDDKLICEGATWSITFNNITKTVKDTIGMSIIAHLIKCQGDFIRADKIYYDIVANILNKDIHSEMHKDELYVQENVSVNSDEVEKVTYVDKKAITDVNNARKKLEKDLQQAELEHDLPKINEITVNLKKLNIWLNQNTNIEGKPRKIPDRLEKARKAIIASVATARKNIKKVHPEFYEHLNKYLTIRQESYYKPKPPLKWSVKI